MLLGLCGIMTASFDLALHYVAETDKGFIEAPKEVIPHFYAPDIPTEDLCSLHGWNPRTAKPEIWDAVLYVSPPVLSRFC